MAAHGGWTAVGSEPIFTVGDVERSVDHYQRLGFETSHPDEIYAFAHRGGNLTIHLAQAGRRRRTHGGLAVSPRG